MVISTICNQRLICTVIWGIDFDKKKDGKRKMQKIEVNSSITRCVFLIVEYQAFN